MNVDVVAIIGNQYDHTAVILQAGEDFTVNLTLADSAAGTIALRFWRKGNTDIIHSVEAAGTAQGVYALTVPGVVTKYLDGEYYWTLWWLPTAGEAKCLMPASSMYVRVAGGVATADIGDYVTESELTAKLVDYVTKDALV